VSARHGSLDGDAAEQSPGSRSETSTSSGAGLGRKVKWDEMHPDLERYDIQNHVLFGLKVSAFDTSGLMRFFAACIEEGGQAVCYGYSLTLLWKFSELPQIPKIANRFEIMVPEGRGFYLLLKMFGVPLRADDSLPEVTVSMLELADEHGYSVMLLGSDEQSNLAASGNIRSRFPNARTLPGMHGYYGPEDEPAVVELINKQRPDILLIGMSSPKKEEFVDRYRHELDARILAPIGGTIDILAGKTKPIPRIVKKLSLTWLYRFCQEPSRLFGPLFRAGMSAIFILIPRLFWESVVRRNQSFSIPEFYAHRGAGRSDQS